MIHQKRKLQFDFQQSNGEDRAVWTVGDLREFLKKVNEHKLSNDLPIQLFRNDYQFGPRGFEVEWEEWTSDD